MKDSKLKFLAKAMPGLRPLAQAICLFLSELCLISILKEMAKIFCRKQKSIWLMLL